MSAWAITPECRGFGKYLLAGPFRAEELTPELQQQDARRQVSARDYGFYRHRSLSQSRHAQLRTHT